MFTGIIEAVGTVSRLESRGGDMRVTIRSSKLDLGDVKLGDSIAVNGICLTAVALPGDGFVADVAGETLKRSGCVDLKVGSRVNLEKALTPTTRLGGHLVSGHVDAIASVLEKRPVGDFVQFTFGVPAGMGKYIIEKGSIAIDGTSLTVNSCDDKTFSIVVIPHTLQVTILGSAQEGSSVNIEVDLIGKYVEKLLQADPGNGKGAPGAINPEFLAKRGFRK